MKPKSFYVCVGAACVVVAVASSPARSQGYPFSQRGAVTQMVAFTEIAVSYGRPVARGRNLFGALVPWDSVWHPGADSATRVTFNHDVLLEGKSLRAGEYSLWLIPRERAQWTVILSRAAHVFHKPYPGSKFDVLRIDVTPEPGLEHGVVRHLFPDGAARRSGDASPLGYDSRADTYQGAL